MLLGVPSISPCGTFARVLSGAGTVSGCLQVGHLEVRPANSGLTFSFMPQWGHEKEIMGASRWRTRTTESLSLLTTTNFTDCSTANRRSKQISGRRCSWGETSWEEVGIARGSWNDQQSVADEGRQNGDHPAAIRRVHRLADYGRMKSMGRSLGTSPVP